MDLKLINVELIVNVFKGCEKTEENVNLECWKVYKENYRLYKSIVKPWNVWLHNLNIEMYTF